jgi:iron-only hydrogenase group A
MVFTIEINNQKVAARSGETILTVLNRNGIKVPTLCHLSGFSPSGACRMCVVEVEGLDHLVTSCSYHVEEWMKIHSHSPRVLKARKTLVELLLAAHPDDCLYCSRMGACELQQLSDELNVTERKYRSRKPSIIIDRSCPAIERDPAKCILCERCIRVCNETIGVGAIEIVGRGTKSSIGTQSNRGLNTQTCVKCGQCIMVCPTGALKERPGYMTVLDALNNKNLHPVIQISPAVQASISEDIGLKAGKDVLALLWTALQKIGFKEVYDTSLGADLTTMELSGELVKRIKNKEKFPLFTSCCPGWVNYIEQSRPDLKKYLATSKTPQQMMGLMMKNFLKETDDSVQKKIFSVSVMPCTAKKHEAEKSGISENGVRDVDAVITTRELVKIIRHFGIDFSTLEPDSSGHSYGMRGSAGKLFGVTGGVTESVIRTLQFQLTGQELSPAKISEIRGLKTQKETRLKYGKTSIGFISVSGLSNAIQLLKEIEAGKNNIHLVEVMACPFGCINGGGQRIGTDEKSLRSRMKALYDADEEELIKVAHKNPAVLSIYEKIVNDKNNSLGTKILHNITD